MARIITKELAEKIIKKLKAKKIDSRGKAHDEYGVEHAGRFVAFISIRRGSSKEQGHDHVPGDLHISPNQAKQLAQCPWQREDYIADQQERGWIEPDQAEEEGASETGNLA